MVMIHGLQTQTYTHELKKCPKSGKQLNYEAINKNNLIPRIRRQQDLGHYDYRVGSHIDFSKLYMQTYMAQYTAFDETCDLSALLGIIVNMGTFPQPVENVAIKVYYILIVQLFQFSTQRDIAGCNVVPAKW